MTTSKRPFNLCALPYSFRIGIALLTLTLLGGYLVSGIHLYWHYENRDQSPGLTTNDIVGAYHGVQSPSPLISALESNHPEAPHALEDYERDALLDWLRSDNLSQNYDNLDLGDEAPAEIIAISCLDCHSRDSAGDNAYPQVPLEYWDDIQAIAYSKDIQPAGPEIIATSQHAHAPTMAIILIVVAFLALTTRLNTTITGLLTLASGFGLLLDMAGWWITRDYAIFAHAIIAGGAIYALGTSLLGITIILDCIIPNLKKLPPQS